VTRFILRRLVIILAALLLINFLGYAYANIAGPIRAARIPYLGWTPQSEPLVPAYATYLKGFLQFDFGQMPGSGETIAAVVSRASLASLGLLALALALSTLIGLALGLHTVRPETRTTSRWLTLLSTAGLAMPSFYIGSVLTVGTLALAAQLNPGSKPPLPTRGFGWDLHLVLPTLALTVRPAIQIAQVTSGLLVDELGKRYIVTARSIGNLWRVIRQQHALRNILASLILTVVGSFRLLMGELILIEWLFNWPGLGRLLASTMIPGQLSVSAGSLLFLTPPVVAAVLTIFAALFLVTDLIAAILVRVVDPRLRAPEGGTGSADVTSAVSGSTRRNWHLILGCLVVLLVIVIAIAGPFLAPKDPLEEHTIIQIGDDWEVPPFPAFKVPGYPLGSDRFGRDLLSRLLWAVRPTMTLVSIVALVRLALGTLIGVIAGWSTGRLERALDAGISGALALPVLMVSLITIAAVGIEIGLPAFIFGLLVNGWAETARVIREQTRLVKGQQYIEAARAVGASGLRILLRHILPQVMPMVWMLLALEISAALMITAGLGFLGYYIGGDVWVEVSDFVARRLAGPPELGQMLAASSSILEILARPWTMLTVGTLIFAAVLGFNLLGEGLRRQLRLEQMGKRKVLSRITSRLVTWIEEQVAIPAAGWVRRHAIPSTVAGLLIVVIAGGLAWWRVQAARQPEGPAIALDVPGGHLWAAGRHDPWGTLSSEATGPTNSEAHRILEDPAGFSGGPAIAADGTVYIASRGETLYALAPDGHIAWRATLPAGAVGPPALSTRGDIHVVDVEGGLSAFTPRGELRWRFRPRGECVPISGPIVAPDETIYYPAKCTTPLATMIYAISPNGVPVWEVRAPAAFTTSYPRLNPTGELLFWENLVIATENGAFQELETPVAIELYLPGADGRTYLISGHTVIEWQPTESGLEILRSIAWDYRRMGTLVTPKEGGVTREQVIWLFYNYSTQVAWLDAGGRVLGTFRYPFRVGNVVAVDQKATIYVCGRQHTSRCLAANYESEDPVWEISIDGSVIGGALAPERLYLAIEGAEEGFLLAIGDGMPAMQTAEETLSAETPTPPPSRTPTLSPTTTLPSPASATPTPTATSPPTPTPTPTSPPAQQTIHVVQRGETLFRIAHHYGTTVEAISKANAIANPFRIYVGQRLVIPTQATQPPPLPSSETTYVVQPGDNLFRIALRHNVSYLALARYNGITNPSRIYVGQVLRIPPR
jgi:peptide/nickel transport system permease protein